MMPFAPLTYDRFFLSCYTSDAGRLGSRPATSNPWWVHP